MAFPVGAVIGAVGGLLGSKSASGANKANYSEILKLLDKYQQQTGQFFSGQGSAEDYLLQALGAITEGYGNARQEVGQLGYDARRRTLEREQQQFGQSSQSLASRGLGNTSVLDNARRGIASDTNRALSEIDEGLASIYAGLSTGQAGATAGALGNLANLQTGQASQIAGLLSSQAGNLAKFQFEAPQIPDLSFLNNLGKSDDFVGPPGPT